MIPCLALPALSCRPKGKQSDCHPVPLAIFQGSESASPPLQSTHVWTGSGPSSSRPSPCPVGVPPWPMCASSARERGKPREYLGEIARVAWGLNPITALCCSRPCLGSRVWGSAAKPSYWLALTSWFSSSARSMCAALPTCPENRL